MFHVLSFKKNLNRVLANSIFFITILMVSLCPVSAETVLNFGQWRNFNSFSKTAYVGGTIDGFLNPLKVSEQQEQFKKNFLLCLKEFNVSIAEIVSLIDNFYLNSSNWGYSPQEAIKYQLVDGHCFHYINKPY